MTLRCQLPSQGLRLLSPRLHPRMLIWRQCLSALITPGPGEGDEGPPLHVRAPEIIPTSQSEAAPCPALPLPQKCPKGGGLSAPLLLLASSSWPIRGQACGPTRYARLLVLRSCEPLLCLLWPHLTDPLMKEYTTHTLLSHLETVLKWKHWKCYLISPTHPWLSLRHFVTSGCFTTSWDGPSLSDIFMYIAPSATARSEG